MSEGRNADAALNRDTGVLTLTIHICQIEMRKNLDLCKSAILLVNPSDMLTSL